jgi:glycosyltransferase involved in cell wall biosynthesis
MNKIKKNHRKKYQEKRMIKIFFVDRFISYSTNMYEKLENIISLNNKFNIQYLGPDKKNKTLFSDQKVKNSIEVWSYGDYLKKLFFYIHKQKPDIVHYCFELQTYGPSLIDVIKFPILLFLTKMIGCKIVLTLHGIFVYKEDSMWKLNYYPSIKIPYSVLKLFANIFMKLVCGISNKVIVGTHIGKLALIEHSRISEDKIEVIQFGTLPIQKLNEEKISEMKKKFQNKKIILYFGVISPRKGQEIAIKALSEISEKIPDFVLVIAGTASKEFKSYEKDLHNLTKKLNLEERVIFTGYVEDDEIGPLFNLSDFSMHVYGQMSSSTYALTFSIQHSKPVIISNIETFHEILNNDEAIFVNIGKQKELENAILNLAKNDDLKRQLQDKMKNVASRFTWEKNAVKHFSIYKTMK